MAQLVVIKYMLDLFPISTTNEELVFRAILKENKLPFQDLDFERFAYFLVKNKQNETVGTAAYERYEDVALLRSIAVIDAFKNKGLGKIIVEKIEQFAENKGITHFYLLTTTANLFFQKQNYYLCDRKDVPEAVLKSTEFSSVCPSSAICLIKKLGNKKP